NAAPYGPFLNRNSLACWLAMAIPLVVSYAIARTSAKSSGTTKLAAIDSTQVWLVGTACLMMGGLLASLSRGGILGGTIGLASVLVLARRRVRRAMGSNIEGASTSTNRTVAATLTVSERMASNRNTNAAAGHDGVGGRTQTA